MCDVGEQDGGNMMLNRPGRLEDSYIIGVLIGRGSYSMVHKCLFKGKSERACKIYKKAHLDSTAITPHVNNILELSHPNLILVYDVFESDSVLQVITELAAGEELLERIERCNHYSEKEASQAVHTILSVLQYLHDKGLAHSGVYPENFLYESEAASANLKLSEISMPKKTQSPTSPSVHSDPTAESLAFRDGGDCAEEWTDVSDSARNLISRLVDGQLSAEEALLHPWVSGATAASRQMLDAQERLKTFNARRKLRATTHAIIATQRAMSIIKPFKNYQPTR